MRSVIKIEIINNDELNGNASGVNLALIGAFIRFRGLERQKKKAGNCHLVTFPSCNRVSTHLINLIESP